MGKLTTHILDTANGGPATGVRVVLERLAPDPAHLFDGFSNRDGRLDAPLLEGEALIAGKYNLTFFMGDYFRARGAAVDEPAFVDEVKLCFGIAHVAQHYHVPLLASPWSYSTYRGS
jgi:5-hydroxyisourate hydrolase